MNNQIKHRLRVILIFVIFLSPFFLAGWLYQHANGFHFKTANLGHLLKDPVIVKGPWSEEKGRWQVVYWPNDGAKEDKQAEQLLYQLHQMRIALGKSKQQLAVGVVLSPNCQMLLCQQQDKIKSSDIDVLSANNDLFIKQLSANDSAQLRQQVAGKVYLIDPQGYFFMYYNDSENPLSILQDLQHILEVTANG
jgi:hypothetical protein